MHQYFILTPKNIFYRSWNGLTSLDTVESKQINLLSITIRTKILLIGFFVENPLISTFEGRLKGKGTFHSRITTLQLRQITYC